MSDDDLDDSSVPNLGRSAAPQELVTQMAVLTNEFRNYRRDTNRRFDLLDANWREAQARYSTKEETERNAKEIAELKNSITWAVKSVIFIVIVSIMGLVVTKTGIPHP